MINNLMWFTLGMLITYLIFSYRFFKKEKELIEIAQNMDNGINIPIVRFDTLNDAFEHTKECYKIISALTYTYDLRKNK